MRDEEGHDLACCGDPQCFLLRATLYSSEKFSFNSLFKMLNKSQRFKSKIIVTQGYVSGQGERKSVVI